MLYVKALAAPLTVNTMPEKTLNALANHTELGRLMATDGDDCESVLGEFAKAGWMSMPSRPVCKTKQPRRSWRRGTASWRSLTRRARR